MVPQTKEELAAFIDHTNLNATAVHSDICRLCDEAITHKFAAGGVNPRWVSWCADMLREQPVKVATVVGFPLGANTTKIKASETEDVIMAGADEVDMVVDLAAVIEHDAIAVRKDIKAVFDVCRTFKPSVLLKVIIEAAALTDEQVRFVSEIGGDIGVDYLKTSTGFHKAGGATIEHVRMMALSAPHCKIKAAGGIRTAKDAMAFIEAGASRIGASASLTILQEFAEGV